jgi:hypothetical protein
MISVTAAAIATAIVATTKAAKINAWAVASAIAAAIVGIVIAAPVIGIAVTIAIAIAAIGVVPAAVAIADGVSPIAAAIIARATNADAKGHLRRGRNGRRCRGGAGHQHSAQCDLQKTFHVGLLGPGIRTLWARWSLACEPRMNGNATKVRKPHASKNKTAPALAEAVV